MFFLIPPYEVHVRVFPVSRHKYEQQLVNVDVVQLSTPLWTPRENDGARIHNFYRLIVSTLPIIVRCTPLMTAF